eukprot:CAMPEP_0116863812 /NCGR_PEP_ID=MMETSP0418-20121206/24452_1 /TAXON_ID=1158023 /ORGANISM="Astrosyne radiata, Strain 13vi08-1A" /LENGTH=81 /DNA_ID=CAMNT_0004498919 /DNA_START=157 /DNA_END=402 /DNA_ORIENTATION=+
MAKHHGLLNALCDLAQLSGSEEAGKISEASIRCMEKLTREPNARPFLAKHESIMMALTQASYGKDPGSPVQLALKNLLDAM